MFKPRPKQAEVLAYKAGKMGVSAVPGSGKTATLSYLGARLVAQADLQPHQEVLIVTLVKSAVGHFAQSMAKYLKEEYQLLPGWGYRVQTLHSLANTIVRERPALVGLADDFTVLDERASEDILQEAVEDWVRLHPDAPNSYLTEEDYNNPSVRHHRWHQLVQDVARGFIRSAKDRQVSVSAIERAVGQSQQDFGLVGMCLSIYQQYERSLRYRGALDFQDLIRLALRVLTLDEDYLMRLRERFPYILEDEAQDSSQLQEAILRLLVGEHGNWVRVGDPNQAIYESFTTANPRYLRAFLREDGVVARTLPNSGRSTLSIIALANALIDWSLNHPHEAVRERKPLDLPHIEATLPDDPQGNPPDMPKMIHFQAEGYTADEERKVVIQSVKRWLEENPDNTCAILLPINASGASMVQALREANVPYVEHLRSTTGTRATIGALMYILAYLVEPRESGRLMQVYRVWQRDERGEEATEERIKAIATRLRGIKALEDYLYPRLNDWLEAQEISDELREHLRAFRDVVRRWQLASGLPIDQLVLTIGADLFQTDTEIATSYQVALYLRRYAELNPQARLNDFAEELRQIARGNRAFSGAGDEDTAFNPEAHRGKVAVLTLHKAKGLEWDRVYILSANNYTFPALDSYDTFMSEKWFIRDNLNLEAEAIEQMQCLLGGRVYQEGRATQEARIEYSAERLRLLYVGITRARRELVVTWNNGQRGNALEARAVTALRSWWAKEKASRL